MGHISTHVLDTVNGKPGANIAWQLFRVEKLERTPISHGLTNTDGRTDGPIIKGADFTPGEYEIQFDIGDYFQSMPSPPKDRFLNIVPVRFFIADADQSYHIPLLVSHYSFSTYRGS